jgi:uncharacterized membrane protein YeaQ/YmgE (transglycosylase-associated protein family)
VTSSEVAVLTLVFILLGLIAGYLAVRRFKSTGRGVPLDLGLGVGGAITTGSLFKYLAAATIPGPTTTSALVAALIGAAALLATFHGLREGRQFRADRL